MKRLFSLLAFVATTAFAQSPPDPNAFRNGVAYTFERKFATRKVHDAFDKASISLATYIFRPLKETSRGVVLFTHGSLGGMTVDPHEPTLFMPAALTQYFVRKGYTVVYSTRRGLGESTGMFREECPFAAGQCTVAEYRALAEPGLAEAEKDTDAVIDQIIEGHEVRKGTKILFSGVSRGGFLALRVASKHPEIAAGVVNFVGGWLSIGDPWDAAENAARAELQQRLFKEVGAGLGKVPTLWIYAARDPFYAEAVTRGFFSAFESGGGTGEYFYVPEHSLRIGHIVATEPALWSMKVDAFTAAMTGDARP
jgi:pimeloyl-ACP methyl ester carboxylesterase